MIAAGPAMGINKPYRHLASFSYDVPFHKWYLIFFATIRDFVVLPNPGDNSLMLCKAYIRFTDNVSVFYCYFLLGHRQEIRYLPW